MLHEKLGPRGTGHNPFAIRLFIIIAVLVGLHLVLIQLDLITLSEKVPIYTAWPDAASFFKWVQSVKAQIVDFYFNTYFISLAVLLAFLLFLHATSDIINQFLDWVFESSRRTFVFLMLLFTTLLRYYLSPGPLTEIGDSCSHLTHMWLCRLGLSLGEAPTWSNWHYCGGPMLQNYGPISFYATALMSLLISDFDLAVKITLGLAHLASGLAFFYTVGSILRDRRIALLSSLLYLLIGWHSHVVLVNGRYPVAFVYIFMPLVFLETWRLLESAGQSLKASFPAIFRLALYASLLFLTHFIYATFQFGIFLFLFAVLKTAFSAWPSRDFSILKALALKCGLALGLFLLFSGGFILPFYLERNASMAGYFMGAENALGKPEVTFNLFSWFIWGNNRFPLFAYANRTWMDTYFGLSTFAFLLLALALKIRFKGKLAFSSGFKALSLTALSVFLVILFWKLWQYVPLLKMLYTAPAYRYQVPLTFFLCLIPAFVVTDIHGAGVLRIRKGFINTAVPLALIIILFDLGSLTFQTPYGLTTDWDKGKRMMEIFREQFEKNGRRIPNERVYYEGLSSYDFDIKGAPLCIRRAYHPCFTGTFAQGAPLSWRFLRSTYPLLHETFETRTNVVINKKTANLFFLTHTRLLLLREDKEVPPQPCVESVERIPGEKTLVHMAFGPPIVFSNVLQKAAGGLPDSLAAGRILDQYEIDYATGRAAAVFTGEEEQAPATKLENAAANVKVSRFLTANKSADMTVVTDAPVFVRLPFSWHPSLKVSVNGKPVAPMREALDFICLRLEAGENEIHLEGGLSRLRKLLLLTGLLAFILAGTACLWRPVHRR